jgi:hypothetical protein
VEKQISKGLKYTFLVHGILGIVFGFGNLLVPNLWESLSGEPVLDPTLYRVLGAAILAFTASSWLAYMETAWERVRIVVLAEMVWCILGALVALGAVVIGARPIGELGNAITLGGFGVAFSFYYFRH